MRQDRPQSSVENYFFFCLGRFRHVHLSHSRTHAHALEHAHTKTSVSPWLSHLSLRPVYSHGYALGLSRTGTGLLLIETAYSNKTPKL